MQSRRAVLVLGGATVIASSAALNALIYALEARHLPAHGPVSLPDFDAARKTLRVPDDVAIVPWDTIAKAGDTLGDVLDRLSAHQLLGLAERDEPYLLDASKGFYATGVSEVQLADGSRQKVTSRAERWFSLARAPRGIVGLGPRAVIAVTPTTWRSPRQPRPVSAKAVGRFFWNLAGVRQKELVGTQEKLIECAVAGGYFGNFTLLGPGDLGGIAYNGITLSKGGTVERVQGSGAWRGFAGVPNGETGLVCIAHGTYLIADLVADGRDPATGKRVGTSPIMISNSPGGRLDNVTAQCSVQGMPTWWNCSGVHELVGFNSRWNVGHGLNLEQALGGFWLRMTGGSLWGGQGGHPSPDGIAGKADIGLDARGQVTVTLVGVDVDARSLFVEGYGSTKAHLAKVTATLNGKSVLDTAG